MNLKLSEGMEFAKPYEMNDGGYEIKSPVREQYKKYAEIYITDAKESLSMFKDKIKDGDALFMMFSNYLVYDGAFLHPYEVNYPSQITEYINYMNENTKEKWSGFSAQNKFPVYNKHGYFLLQENPLDDITGNVAVVSDNDIAFDPTIVIDFLRTCMIPETIRIHIQPSQLNKNHWKILKVLFYMFDFYWDEFKTRKIANYGQLEHFISQLPQTKVIYAENKLIGNVNCETCIADIDEYDFDIAAEVVYETDGVTIKNSGLGYSFKIERSSYNDWESLNKLFLIPYMTAMSSHWTRLVIKYKLDYSYGKDGNLYLRDVATSLFNEIQKFRDKYEDHGGVTDLIMIKSK